MPRDLPTRHVFLSRSHFVSFIPLVLLRVVSDPEVEEVEFNEVMMVPSSEQLIVGKVGPAIRLGRPG